MYHKQKGLGFIGFVFMTFVAVSVVVLAFKVFPVYLEHQAVKSALDELPNDASLREGVISQKKVTDVLSRRFEINDVKHASLKDNVTTHAENGEFVVEIAYQVVTPLFSNVSLLFDFDDEARIPMR